MGSSISGNAEPLHDDLKRASVFALVLNARQFGVDVGGGSLRSIHARVRRHALIAKDAQHVVEWHEATFSSLLARLFVELGGSASLSARSLP